MAQIRYGLALVSVALWWGGLTFYSLIVVPVGAEQIGSTGQGLITQQVTQWLNAFGGLSLVVTLWEILARGNRWLLVAWCGVLICLLAVFVLHGTLDGMIDPELHTISDGGRFYRVHRVYLLITTVQWGLGLWLLLGLSRQGGVSKGLNKS